MVISHFDKNPTNVLDLTNPQIISSLVKTQKPEHKISPKLIQISNTQIQKNKEKTVYNVVNSPNSKIKISTQRKMEALTVQSRM